MRHRTSHVPEGGRVKPRVITVCDCSNDDTANRPKHLQHLRSRGAQPQRDNLAAVCRRIGNEDTPWQTLQKLSYEDNWERIAKVEYEDEGIQEHEASQGRITVSNAAGEGTSEEDANQRTELARHLQRGLPFSLNDHLVGFAIVYAVPIRECRQADKIVDKEDIVRFHDLAKSVSCQTLEDKDEVPVDKRDQTCLQ